MTRNPVIRQRLDEIIASGHSVLIGDANGADRAVQQNFADRGYGAVTVHCIDGACRNNVRQWPLNAVDGGGRRGYELYARKDAEMARGADRALMIWDRKSRGTLANVERMTAAGKPSVVFVAPERCFFDVANRDDLDRLRNAADE